MEIGKKRAETGTRNPHPKDGNARNCPPEIGARELNPRECRWFSPTGKNHPGDGTAWLMTQSAANLSHLVFHCFSLFLEIFQGRIEIVPIRALAFAQLNNCVDC